MKELEIVGWTYFEDKYPSKKMTQEEIQYALRLVATEIVKNGYKFSGEEHQNSFTGVPVFSDGTCFRASMRSWGMIMASLYRDSEGNNLSYMDFYMSLGDESVLPEENDFDVEVGEVEETTWGLTCPQDRDIVLESLQLGMPFMTTDKVLQEMYDTLSKMSEN